MLLREKRLILVLGKTNFRGGGGTADGSKLIKKTLNSVWPSGALLKRSQPFEKNILHFFMKTFLFSL